MGNDIEALAKRIGFRVAAGLSERVIYKELFLNGLTLLDLKRGSGGPSLTMSHVAARQEVRDLRRIRLRVPRDDPGMRRAAGRTRRRDERVGLVGHEVRDREGIPGASAPPEGAAAHDREPEAAGREGMGEHDAVFAVEDDAARGREHAHEGADQSGLADPVAAEQADDPAFGDVQVDPVQHAGARVPSDEVVDLQHGHSCTSASSTSGLGSAAVPR